MTPALEAPPTLSLPLPENFPGHPELLIGLKERESAKIAEGYMLWPNTTHLHLPFTFYAEININNSRFWKLFTSLAYFLPETVSWIYNLYEQEASYGPYMNKKEIIQFLEKFELELTQDCNMEFGLIFQTDEELEEIFVAETKYIKVWSSKQAIFRQLMRTFGLEEIPDLKFNDEFPKTVTHLTSINANAKPTRIIINEMNDYFQIKE